MLIHTISSGERIKDIAEKYGINEENLRLVNELYDGDGADGEELLVLIPTRSYTVQNGDSAESIAIRFGISIGDIYSFNPWIERNRLKAGQTLALKYGARQGGMAVANGYFFKGCTEKMLWRAMPYLTYITFAAAMADNRGIRNTASFEREIQIALKERKIPLLRIYDRFIDRYRKGENLQDFAEQIIDVALKGGYKGVVLDSCSLNDSAQEFSSFLMELRKLMIGCDLILITEINDTSPSQFSELADGSVIYYPKYAMKNPPDFENGERAVLSDFACKSESAKAFVDLPSLTRWNRDFVTTADALKYARMCERIEHNESTLLSHFSDKKQGEYCFCSLRNIKALLDLIDEFGYMGICFDIMRTPLSYLMMYNAMFKTSYCNSVRTREGCSRADVK